MAKRNRCGECDWEPTGKKRYPWECSRCGDVFPCKQKDCGHLDCSEETARKCHICSKVVPNTSSVYYFLDGKGIDMYSIHRNCADADCVVKIYE